MSKIRIYGDTSGYVDLTAPAVADNRNIDLPSVLDSKLDLAGGKILQVVRATDSTDRSTTSTSVVDTGITVTITPQENTSSILLIFMGRMYVNRSGSGDERCELYIRNSGGTVIGGPYNNGLILAPGNLHFFPITLIGYDSPSTTSATTYKISFNATAASNTVVVQNSSAISQFFAIEVSA